MSAIAEKVEHVLAASQSRDHHCHWPGCTRQVPPAKWGCSEHWFKLPSDIRQRIWRAYRIGQEEDGRPGAAYLEAAHEAQAWIAKRRPSAPEPSASGAALSGLPDRPAPQWQRNTGKRPEGEFKRVRVMLRNGREPAYSDALNPMCPPGWAVDTTRWSLTGHPYDVSWFLPL